MATAPPSRSSPPDDRHKLSFVLNGQTLCSWVPCRADSPSPPYSPITPQRPSNIALPVRNTGSLAPGSSSPLSSPTTSPSLLESSSMARDAQSPTPSEGSVASSDLSILSRSPTPPTHDFPISTIPPSSQPDSVNTPRSTDESTCSSSNEQDGPPKKRRRISKMPRHTQKLDLDQLASNPDPESAQILDRLVKGLQRYKKIVVIAGAGISVSAGIPDFRSKHGIFKSLKSEHKLKGSGKDLFDASVYGDGGSTETFHKMVRNMSSMVKSAKPTPFHDLCARLAHEGRLLRMYTQNVDGLETMLEPLGRPSESLPLHKKGPWPKTIQLHGCLDKVVCTKCNKISNFDADMFDSAMPPACEDCEHHDNIRTQHAGKRSHGIGRLRPRMVLYNEHNPDDEAIGQCTLADVRARPDCVLVVGTSMKIPGVRRMVREMCNTVRARRDGMSVWINCDPEPLGKEYENSWDIIVRGTSDDVANRARLGKWDEPQHLISPESVVSTHLQPSIIIKVHSDSMMDETGLPTPRDSPSNHPEPTNAAQPSSLSLAQGSKSRIALSSKTTRKALGSTKKTKSKGIVKGAAKPQVILKFPVTKASTPTSKSAGAKDDQNKVIPADYKSTPHDLANQFPQAAKENDPLQVPL